jgi:ankyrin repeat protein
MNAPRQFVPGLLSLLLSFLASLLLFAGAVHAQAPDQPAQKLIDAVRGNDSAAYRQALAAGGDVSLRDEGDNTLVAIAAQAGSSAILKDLLGRGARVGELGSLGNTALGFASARGDVKMIADLLAAGADLSVANAQGEPPLVDAVRSGNARAIELLLDRGADRDQAAGELRMTPLMVSIKEDKPEAFQVLLERRVDLERQDANGATALYWAIHEDRQPLVERLLAAGAEHMNVITGHSALAVAVGEKREAIAELIRDKCPRCE